MLLKEDSRLSISFSKTLVRTVDQAFWITTLSSNGYDNRCNLNVKISLLFAHEKLMFYSELNMHGVKVAA